jgi:CDP-6-deoxy-D-xylo-4-hexulose-3-dehydrase
MKDKRAQILELTKEYYAENLKASPDYAPGDRINYGGRVFDENEVVKLVDSSLDFWLTAGRYVDEFEKSFADFLGLKHCSLTNSGSSANLLAFMALTSSSLGERRICKGDEVITAAAGFPTTVAPIVQYGAVPVFIDMDIPSYNVDVSKLEDALSQKTKAVFLAHTLGNPFNLKGVKSFCEKHDLWLIEDNCDSLGSKYDNAYTGTFGDIATSSFYPPHHMTMGEGGAVYTNNAQLKKIVESFRDWGRDCWCKSGHDNSCGCRFTKQFGSLPHGYDHKYVYSHLGYNLKATEMQAAVGCAQLEKLPSFIDARKKNWKYLRDSLTDMADFFILPEAEKNSDPSWFGFMLTVRENAPFSRNDIVSFLEDKNIQTRMLFAGNITRHPCFEELREGTDFKVVDELKNTDRIMNDSFWLGVYPGLNKDRLDYMISCLKSFVKKGD